MGNLENAKDLGQSIYTKAEVNVDFAHKISSIAELASLGSSTPTVIVTDTDRGGIFVWSESGTANGGTVFAGSSGYWVRQYSGAVNVKWFGAVGDGVTDDTAAIQSALATSNNIFIPEGTYKCTDTLVLPKDITLEGTSGTVLDFNHTETVVTNQSHIETVDVGLTALPALSSAISEFNRELPFVSAHNLSVGDIIVIYDPNDYSWAKDRTYYHKGERGKVATIDTSTSVSLDGVIYDSYTTGVEMYKHSNTNKVTIRNLTILGKPSETDVYIGLTLTRVNDSVIDNLSSTGASYTALAINQSYDVSVTNSNFNDDYSSIFGGDYGIVSGNSQNIYVSNSYMSAGRHSFTTGGSSGVGCVVNYNILVNNCTLKSRGGAEAADHHNNTAYSGFRNCTINGAAVIAGKHCFLEDNIIVESNYETDNDILVFVICCPSMSHTIRNNTLLTNKDRDDVNQNPIITTLITSGSNGSYSTDYGGTLDISGNTLEMSSLTDAYYPIIGYGSINIDSLAANDKANINIHNNNISNKVSSGYGGIGIFLRGSASATRAMDEINITNNTFNNLYGFIQLNIITGGPVRMFDRVFISNNSFNKCYTTGCFISSINYAVVTNNIFKDYLLGGTTGSSTTNGAMYFEYNSMVVESNNTTISSSPYLNCRVGASSTVNYYYKGPKADITSQIDRNTASNIITM